MRSGPPSPARVLVVVPARDEEALVGGCVRALLVAAARVDVPVDVVVVADGCRDRTAAVARAAGARVLVHDAAGAPGGRGRGGVGAARAAGIAAGLQDLDPAGTWIACTDADSVVPPCWLEHQLEHARAGADLVLGVVDPTPAEVLGHPGGPVAADRPARTGGPDGDDPDGPWRRRYAAGVEGTAHRHVHGANLGVRASTYLAVGGFAPLPAHEDVRLAEAVARLDGAHVLTTVVCPVLTSDRRVGRTPAGLAHDLRTA